MEINNSFIPNTSYGEKLCRFIVDNYAAPRDIPQVTLKQPRPYYQVGDRVRDVDSYTGITKEFIINNLDEVFSIDDVITNVKLREADKGTGAYNPALSQAVVVYENRTDYNKLAETVDIVKGGTSTEVRRDIYMMSGISYHGRRFNFATGTYSVTPPGPAPVPPAPAGVVEKFTGEPRTFAAAPLVICSPLYFPRVAGGGAVNTQGISTYAIPATLSNILFDGFAQTNGYSIVNGWFHWVAIGVTQTIT